MILGHADVKTTRRAYARPSVEMLRQEMSKSSLPEGSQEKDSEVPLWKDDEELAKLCGVR